MNGLDRMNSVASTSPVHAIPALVTSYTSPRARGCSHERAVLTTSLVAMMVPALAANAWSSHAAESGLTASVSLVDQANFTELSKDLTDDNSRELPAHLVLTKESADLVWSLISNPPEPPQALIDLMNEP